MNKPFGNTVNTYFSFGITILSIMGVNLSASALPALMSLKFPQAPENTGAPGATVGGGVRSGGGQCLNLDANTPPLQVLVPTFLTSPKTTSQTPTLYFYVPDNQGKIGEIRLENILGEAIYQERLTIDPQASILSATLLPNTPLDANEMYSWSLRIICDPAEPSQDVFLKGSFEYVDRPEALPPIPEPITPDNALAIAGQYAEKGLWLDSLNLLFFVHPSSPQEWEEMLESAGLGDLVGVPLQKCCGGERLQ